MTTTAHREREVKLSVPDDATLPDLHELPGVERVSAVQELDLDATYYDTPQLRLLDASTTLRRRTGGQDAGWHLKLPVAAHDRHELHEPLDDSDTPPPALAELVRAHLRDGPVEPVALVSTRRLARRLLAADGTTLAEVADDHVSARSLIDGTLARRWREWEVELVAGPPQLLTAAQELLLRHGAAPAPHRSKAARALKGADDHGDRHEERVTRSSPEQHLLSSVLDAQLRKLKEQDARVRADEAEGIHKMRVATRRLRSFLASAGPEPQPGFGDHLRRELKWLTGELSAARDARVLRERLTAQVRAEPVELVLGPVPARLEHELGRAEHDGLRRARAALASARYFRLLDALDDLAAAPLGPARTHGRAGRSATRLAVRDWKRLRRAARVAAQASPADRDVALHEVRKKAKRLRYTIEAMAPALPRSSRKVARRARHLQDLLGDHHDGVVARPVLRRLAAQTADLGNENGFTFGRLHALEQARARDLEREYARAVERVTRRRVRRHLG